MRIWINDTQLDTYDGSVSVSKTNNLWKFGKAEFVHTQTVKIPATNNNKAMLDFADEFRTQSSVARGFVNCLVDIDGVFEQGRLYVSGYSDGEFSVILTFGKELQSLDVKLSEAITAYNKTIMLYENDGFIGVNAYNKDDTPTEKVFISSNFIKTLLSNSGINLINYGMFDFGNSGILTKYNTSDVEETFSTIEVGLNEGTYFGLKKNKSEATTPVFSYNINSGNPLSKYIETTNVPHILAENWNYNGQTLHSKVDYYGKFRYFNFPRTEAVLSFGSECSEYSVIFLDGQRLTDGNSYPLYYLITKQFGKYIDFRRSFDGNEVHNDLSNTTLKVPADTPFLIVNYLDYYLVYGQDEKSYTGGLYYKNMAFSFNFYMQVPFFNTKLLPDITIYQFLQISTSLTGRLMYFDGSKYTTTNDIKTGIVFNANIVNRGSYDVSDKVFDFAQKNIIRYKTGDVTPTIYDVVNVHLSAEKVLFEIPFDSGENYSDSVKPYNDFPIYADKRGAITCQTIQLRKNPNIGNLFAKTRQVKIKFRMTYLDFTSVRELDNFEYKGARLQWSSLQWSDGLCTATLQTIY